MRTLLELFLNSLGSQPENNFMNIFEKELEKIGLSDKESRVYLAAVEFGAAPVQAIAQKANVNRATTYVMIESLTARGLMGSYQKGKKRFFVAESPENILALIKEEKERVAQKEEGFKRILTDLKALAATSKEQPKVTFFEGAAGIERLREAIHESKSKVIEEFAPIDDAYKYFPPHENDHRKNLRKKFEIKLIYSSKKGPFLPPKEGGVERRFVSAEKYSFAGDIAIYGSRVNIIYYAPKLLGVLIEHEGISNTFHQLFSLA